MFLAKGHITHPLCSPHRQTSLCTHERKTSAFVPGVHYLKKKNLNFPLVAKPLQSEATKGSHAMQGKETEGVILETASTERCA